MSAKGIALLDTVALTEDVPAAGLVRGQVGTVVEDLGGNTFEVEFVDPATGRPYSLIALDGRYLLPLAFAPDRT